MKYFPNIRFLVLHVMTFSLPLLLLGWKHEWQQSVVEQTVRFNKIQDGESALMSQIPHLEKKPLGISSCVHVILKNQQVVFINLLPY